MKLRHLFALAALTLCSTAAVAQSGTNTPYSAFGYGILRDHATSAQRAMGSVGVAMSSGRQTNAMNPASYAAIDTLTFLFDMGLDYTHMSQTEGDKSNSQYGGGLDYATMHFPITRWMGASVGVLPFSSVGYSFGNDISNGYDSRQGSGGINQLYGGLALRPFKGFSVGANVSYLFGNILNSTYALPTSSSSMGSVFQDQMEVRDYYINLGAMYGFNVAREHRITLGATFAPEKTLLGTARQVYYEQGSSNGVETKNEHPLKDNYTIPYTVAAGINYEWDRTLMFEADYTFQPWTKAKYKGFEPLFNFADRSKYAVGLQYVPNFRGNYLSRINYRIGAYMCDDYMKFKDNQMKEFAITAGFGFPVPAMKSTVNLGLEWMRRQTSPTVLIKENYLNLTLGITFNEMWFHQRKLY